MDVGLYDSIFRRKSVRKYNMDPISQGTIGEISDHLETLEPLCPEIKVRFMFADMGK